MNKLITKCLLIFSLLMINITHAASSDPWASYIDGTVGLRPYYLYNLAVELGFQSPGKYRAVDLGSGAGNADVELVMKGWDVLGLDISPRSGVVINERVKGLRGHFQFQQGDFVSINLIGAYDLVMAFTSLPFGQKKDLPTLLINIGQHMKKGGIFSVNFFGNESTYVKKGEAYGVTREEITFYLARAGFQITHFLNRKYQQADYNGNETEWDMLDIIAVKN